MVEGMRADCLIVDSRPREQPFPLTWAHALDPGIPLASQPGQPRQPLQPASSQQLPRTPKSTPKVTKIKPRELKIHEKVEKAEPIKNISIYYVLHTSKHPVLP